ncbi:glycosyltransferase [Microvirga terrae]|uniref:Glycosyltransferase n=1 Tax=Microvirga terrae TaxID=2740529 RepID=A0ABY5RN65_9HYPH|nr:glycosyltransferase [Microvirga terrae]UVF18433.1 glycosyltransferase [Microvirga terrae]
MSDSYPPAPKSQDHTNGPTERVQPADASVSVIITTFNDSHYLGDALNSVTAQSVKPQEVIIVDDGSSDDPSAVAALYPGVRIIRQSNQGLAAARNTGLRAASGRYVLFLDADDILFSKAIEANLQQFKANPSAGFVYGAYRYVDEHLNVLHVATFRPVGDDPYADFLKENCIGMHAAVLYRRQCLEAIGGFDASLRACEDYDVYLRMAQKYSIACQPKLIADYRRHDRNMSHNAPMMLATALKVLDKQKLYASSNEKWRNARRTGILSIKQYYLLEHLRRVRSVLSRGHRRGEMARQTLSMFSMAPGSFLTVGLRGGLRVAAKRRDKRTPRMGDLRRTIPFSKQFGYDRGKPLDRHYIEAFLMQNASDIKGRVLEVGDSSYTLQFGGERVATADVLNRFPGNPQTTFLGDLAGESNLPSDTFDCVVLTQTLHLVYDMQAAVRTLLRVLRPGGVLLLTVPWISPIDRGEWGDTWYWSLSPHALGRLLSEHFGSDHVSINHYGNVLSATAFLYGLAEHELTPQELDVHDRHCPVIVAGRAIKGVVA